MKVCVALCLCVLAAVASARPQSKYTDRYDNVDLDQILSNRRLLIPYIQCVLEEGKCTPDGKELRSHIREALENDCAKCTDNQREGSRRVIAHLIKHEQESWAKLKAKYDPSGKYSKRHEQELAEAKA